MQSYPWVSATRKVATLHLFFQLADDASDFEVADVAETVMPLRILPDSHDFDMPQINSIFIGSLPVGHDLTCLK